MAFSVQNGCYYCTTVPSKMSMPGNYGVLSSLCRHFCNFGRNPLPHPQNTRLVCKYMGRRRIVRSGAIISSKTERAATVGAVTRGNHSTWLSFTSCCAGVSGSPCPACLVSFGVLVLTRWIRRLPWLRCPARVPGFRRFNVQGLGVVLKKYRDGWARFEKACRRRCQD